MLYSPDYYPIPLYGHLKYNFSMTVLRPSLSSLIDKPTCHQSKIETFIDVILNNKKIFKLVAHINHNEIWKFNRSFKEKIICHIELSSGVNHTLKLGLDYIENNNSCKV